MLLAVFECIKSFVYQAAIETSRCYSVSPLTMTRLKCRFSKKILLGVKAAIMALKSFRHQLNSLPVNLLTLACVSQLTTFERGYHEERTAEGRGFVLNCTLYSKI